MRPAWRAVCVHRPGALVLAGCSVVHSQADYSNHVSDKRPREPLCHHQFHRMTAGCLVSATWTSRYGQSFNWAQWSIIGAGVLLCRLFVLFMAAVIARSLFRKLWHEGWLAPRS